MLEERVDKQHQAGHQELIDRRGLYYKLYEQQLALGDGS